jgi:hypothetical protein
MIRIIDQHHGESGSLTRSWASLRAKTSQPAPAAPYGGTSSARRKSASPSPGSSQVSAAHKFADTVRIDLRDLQSFIWVQSSDEYP